MGKKDTKSVEIVGDEGPVLGVEVTNFKPKFRLLTAQQLSEWTGIAVSTLDTMRHRPGKDPIPYVKIGKRIRYREDQILKWLERNNFHSTEEQKEHRAG